MNTTKKEFNFNVVGAQISNEVTKDLLPQPYSYLLISKGNEQLVEDINKALKEVIEDGTSKSINEKWFDQTIHHLTINIGGLL